MIEYEKDSYEYNFKVCLDKTRYTNLADMELINNVAKNVFKEEKMGRANL